MGENSEFAYERNHSSLYSMYNQHQPQQQQHHHSQQHHQSQQQHHHHNNHSQYHHKTADDDRIESDARSVDSFTSSSSSSMKISYSVNSQSEYAFALGSAEKAGKELSLVQKMRLKFENIENEFKYRPPPRFIPDIPPKPNRNRSKESAEMSQDNGEVRFEDEVRSEDEVEDFDDSEDNVAFDRISTNSQDGMQSPSKFRVELQIPAISVDDSHIDAEGSKTNGGDSSYLHDNGVHTLRFGFRPHSHPVHEATNRHIVYKSYSVKDSKPGANKDVPQSEATKHDSSNIETHECLIINELIATEQSYVDTLKRGLKNYVSIYEDEINLPASLRGKKYFLFGNIEQIVELHEDELLPMLKENRNDVAKICEKFYGLLMENRFYGYVLYAINKSNSEKICIEDKPYFKNIQELAGDKLGIDSFLVQPIQRLPRYGLLFEELISKYFKGDIVKYKTEVALCCKVEKHIRNLLETVNSAMQINDIQECSDINLLYQGCFKRCFDFTNYDHAVRRSYKCRLFIFERSVVYTEIAREKKLIYRGYYPRERIGIVVGKKNFSLFYQKRKVQECDFSGDTHNQEPCVEHIMAMMKAFAIEEKEKIQEKYKKVSDVFRRPGPRLQLYPSSRYSNDSGLGSIVSATSNTSDEANPRTTWYTESFLTSGI